MKDKYILYSVTFVVMLCIGAVIAVHPERETSMAYFTDYTNTAWGDAAEIAHAQGYVHGKGDQQFHPMDDMTRGEIAVLILRAAYGTDYQPEGDWPNNWFDDAVSRGLIPDGDPGAPVLRADVIVLFDILN